MMVNSPAQRSLPLFAVFEETAVKNDGMAETNLLSLSYGRIVPKSIDTVGGLLPASFESYQIVNPGQIVLRLTDMQNDQKSLRSGLVRERGIITSAYCALQSRGWGEEWNRYFDYFFHALDVSKQLYSLGGGVRQSLKYADIKHVRVLIPSESARDQIVRYLDVETAKIDHLIAKQRELLKLLDLRDEARWNEAFTGFTPLKTLPLKRLLVKQYRPVVEGAGVVTAFRNGEVTLRSNRREEGFTFSESEAGYQGVVAGDLVFHGLDGFAGAVGISDSDGQSTPVYHICRLRNEDDNLQFIAYLLRYLGNSGFLATQAPSVRQRAVDFRNWQTFGRIPLSLPDGKAQQRIVSELDESAEALARARTTIERALGLLQERRSALITAAVTGQIEV
ncbi:restriction endonuclease subunit S [Dermabacter sp. HMSC06F07]|uniref:restriction endonuclease subunit S n=1 Tax=Dermabacter sp. HMSC06F07 TaxID=1581125 RepID=UPI001AEF83B0|nr:restriction endonuclease subunit S [Dermabacter sp. HMSC06F07]